VNHSIPGFYQSSTFGPYLLLSMFFLCSNSLTSFFPYDITHSKCIGQTDHFILHTVRYTMHLILTYFSPKNNTQDIDNIPYFHKFLCHVSKYMLPKDNSVKYTTACLLPLTAFYRKKYTLSVLT
jgi:hypothetical protein